MQYDLNDECGGLLDDSLVWVVTDYTIGDYCGEGEAVALGKDGMIYFANLGHCSCYGPADDGFTDKMTVEEYLREKDNVLDKDFTDKIKVKVKELLGL